MKYFAAVGSKCILFVGVLLVFCISALPQASLRKAVDTDGDNKADFMVFRPANNVWYILKSGGGPNPYTFQNFGIASMDFMTPGDYDGDGKGDISVWRDTDGVWYRLNSSTSTFVAGAFGMTGDEPVARDYDGDGKTDPAVVRRTNGTMVWYVLRSTDLGFSSQQFGLSTDFTAPGDYDGDGKFDLAVQRPGASSSAQGTFFIQQTSAGLAVVNWGLSNDLVVPGDYDGDGKTDIAVIREGATATSPLVWYVLQSSNGGLLAAAFGDTGTDLNTQNDYDGDGKTDMSIWRNSTGTFWYRSSLTLTFNAVQWGSPNDFPIAAYDTH